MHLPQRRACGLGCPVSNVLWPYDAGDPESRLAFECPGCGMVHALPTVGPRAWSFNGDLERPTFSPSILARWTSGPEHTAGVCHSFVRDGKIEFLGDCTHGHAGQTVPLAPISETP